MHITRLLAVAIGFAILSGCDSATEPAPDQTVHIVDLPRAYRPYDAIRGGVQLTSIYFDQKANRDSVGVDDEWVVLEASGMVNTTGWKINAGDAGQDYALPNAIDKRLVIYTVKVPDTTTSAAIAMGRCSTCWVWNNTSPDTARIFDAGGQLVQEFTYKGQ